MSKGTELKEHKSELKRRVNGMGLVQPPHLDSWANLVTGLGIAGRDRRTATKMEWTGLLMNEHMAESTYAGSNLARRIVDYLPYEATRMPLKFTNIAEKDQAIKDDWARLNCSHMFFTAWSWARIYGGAGLLIMTDEGDDDAVLATPLRPERVGKITNLIPLNRYELDVWGTDIETRMSDPNFRKPRSYRLNVTSGGIRIPVNVRIHASRLIRFEGMELPPLLYIRNKYWGDSIFSGLLEAMRDYDSSHSGVAQVLGVFRFLVHKIPDAAELIAEGKTEVLRKRVMEASASRTLLGATVIDKEEEIESKSETFAGVFEMLDKMADRFAAHTEYPKIILFNESPEGGLGAKGTSELSQWYNTVNANQTTYYAPKLDQFLSILFASKQGPFAGSPPKDWDYDFPSLWSESAKDKADREKVEADADGERLSQGVQDEVAIMQRRFPDMLKGKDPEQMRKQIEAAKQKAMEEQAALAPDPTKAQGA
jgi:phage-related protein (TIGR01555 family)